VDLEVPVRAHPAWCEGTETRAADHVSKTLHAGAEDDPIDIRLRLSQPEDEPEEQTRWTTLELEFLDGGELSAFPLDLDQARALAASLGQLLPPAAATA
jgi:hypothetical protein